MVDPIILIERWQAGDERSAEALYNYYRDATYRLAYGLLSHREDAEEAAQDALTYALVNIGRYDASRSRFSTWLHTITVSRCRDKRRRKVLPSIPLSNWLQRGQDIVDVNDIPPEPLSISRETSTELLDAISVLKPVHREAILLRYWAGHTYKEIGEIMGCPVATAQSRVRLAYGRLRKTLEQDAAYSRELTTPKETGQ